MPKPIDISLLEKTDTDSPQSEPLSPFTRNSGGVLMSLSTLGLGNTSPFLSFDTRRLAPARDFGTQSLPPISSSSPIADNLATPRLSSTMPSLQTNVTSPIRRFSTVTSRPVVRFATSATSTTSMSQHSPYSSSLTLSRSSVSPDFLGVNRSGIAVYSTRTQDQFLSRVGRVTGISSIAEHQTLECLTDIQEEQVNSTDKTSLPSIK